MLITDPTFDPSREWDSAFPEEMEFYHLGKMVSVSKIPSFTGQAVGLDIFAHPPLLLVLHFPHGCDASVYAEFANVLACRLAQKLDHPKEGSLWVTPPKYFSFLKIPHKDSRAWVRRCFIHQTAESRTPLEVLVFAANPGGQGHA